MPTIQLQRVHGEFGIEAKDGNGHIIKMDSSPESGGQDFGVRPMQTLLMGLGGCSAIDVMSILKKQRQEVTDYKINISGEREQGKEPSLWKDIKVVFELKGNIDVDKAYRACELSMEKYCSVAFTLRNAGTKIKWEVKVN